jgi:phosphoribosylglycinamide formyltransferase-1
MHGWCIFGAKWIRTMKRIVIFASGSGTNAQRIAEHFKDNPFISIDRIYCNKKEAYVLQRAKKLGIPTLLFNRDDLKKPEGVLRQLQVDNPDLIVLAGFLWLIPDFIIKQYSNKIINIHPALLPKYGGKGMYGNFVHQAVIDNDERESGITIHYVNEFYDEGMVIYQSKCPVLNSDSPDSLAAKIHQLEHKHYPETIAKLLHIPKK